MLRWLSPLFCKRYVPHDKIEDVWLEIYTNVEDHWALYSLAEQVTALEYYFQEWR
ncbi:MAG: hypothetical protein AAF607_02830 [Pseudomonadota bacterium]